MGGPPNLLLLLRLGLVRLGLVKRLFFGGDLRVVLALLRRPPLQLLPLPGLSPGLLLHCLLHLLKTAFLALCG